MYIWSNIYGHGYIITYDIQIKIGIRPSVVQGGQEAQMWHVDDQSIETKECHFTKELSNRLGQACEELSAPQEEIIAQALREFLDKHGIQYHT